MCPADHTLSKNERLHGANDISRLLAEGHFGTMSGLKYCCRYGNGLPYNRIMVSVPKKIFRRAVKRNLLKRRIRESYRLQKHSLVSDTGADIMFVYISKEVMPFTDIYKTVGNILDKISSSSRHSDAKKRQ